MAFLLLGLKRIAWINLLSCSGKIQGNLYDGKKRKGVLSIEAIESLNLPFLTDLMSKFQEDSGTTNFLQAYLKYFPGAA